MAAIVFSEHNLAGIDIEHKQNKIIRIKNKFLNDSEKLENEYQYNVDNLTMMWTAKESIYKELGIKGVSLSDNIIIKNINKSKGHGYYIKGKEKYKFDLKFFSIEEYILCYAQSNN